MFPKTTIYCCSVPLLLSICSLFAGVECETNFKSDGALSGERRVLHRVRRATDFTGTDQQVILDEHNRLRAGEGSSDMEHMVWHSVLADMAQGWADTCDFDHGQPAVTSPPYDPIGQNIYTQSGNTLNVVAILNAWFQEKAFYDYPTKTCQANQMCGHYTQLVWGKSRDIGCGWQTCATIKGSTITNGLVVVCNYGPAGNYPSQFPYQKGSPCTLCDNGHSWCLDDLCERDCPSTNNPGCSCQADCKNCGTKVETATQCSCTCEDGWMGADCSQICQDLSSNCNQGWPAFMCTDATYGKMIRDGCPLMCQLCVASNGTSTCVTTTATTATTSSSSIPSTSPSPVPSPSTSSSPSPVPSPSPSPVPSPSTYPSPSPVPTPVPSPSPSPVTSPSTAPSSSPVPSPSPSPVTSPSTSPSPSPVTSPNTSPSPSPVTSSSPSPTSTWTPVPTTPNPVPCATFPCQNGGTAYLDTGLNLCKCLCTAKFQGDNCQEIREEIKISVKTRLYAHPSKFQVMWEALRSIFAPHINKFCNTKVRDCCSGSNVFMSAAFREWCTASEVTLATGSPVYTREGGNDVIDITFYVYGAPNNALCAAYPPGSGRRKREIPSSVLDPTILKRIINENKQDINYQLQRCCGGTIGETVLAKENTVDPPTPQGQGLPVWALAVAPVAGFLLCVLLVTGTVVCLRRNEMRMSYKKHGRDLSRREYLKRGPMDWRSETGYSNHVFDRPAKAIYVPYRY